MICTKCHSDEATWDFKDEHFCQDCFEAVTSESWWNLYDATQGRICDIDALSKLGEIK
jgi:hypothetical protein